MPNFSFLGKSENDFSSHFEQFRAFTCYDKYNNYIKHIIIDYYHIKNSDYHNFLLNDNKHIFDNINLSDIDKNNIINKLNTLNNDYENHINTCNDLNTYIHSIELVFNKNYLLKTSLLRAFAILWNVGRHLIKNMKNINIKSYGMVLLNDFIIPIHINILIDYIT